MSEEYHIERYYFLVKYCFLLIAIFLAALWEDYYKALISNLRIGVLYGYILPFIALTLVVMTPDIIRFVKAIYFTDKQKFRLQEISYSIGEYVYMGKPLFYVDENEQDQFNVLRQHKSLMFQFNLRRVFFREFPVIYYNTTAKEFLNWIDFAYLRTLQRLHDLVKAKIVVVLHIDESLYEDGYFREEDVERYKRLLETHKEIVRKVVGKETVVLDELHFYMKMKGGLKRFPEYFFGILTSRINFYARKIATKELDYQGFYRRESNLISTLPIIILSERYKHLFAVDYEGSFEVWQHPPYPEFKKHYNIYFIKCRKIAGPSGERIPSWHIDDGINITDDTHTIHGKLLKESPIVLDAMGEIILGAKDFGTFDTEVKINMLFNHLKEIKTVLKL
jgi:hypothetical protein